jgi:hypothetical protein
VHALPIGLAALAGGAIAASTNTVATSAAPLPTMVGMRGVSSEVHRGFALAYQNCFSDELGSPEIQGLLFLLSQMKPRHFLLLFQCVQKRELIMRPAFCFRNSRHHAFYLHTTYCRPYSTQA